MSEDQIRKILRALSLLTSVVHYKGLTFSKIIDKSEIILKHVSGEEEMTLNDYDELDKN